jgi:hypothetical protein
VFPFSVAKELAEERVSGLRVGRQARATLCVHCRDLIPSAQSKGGMPIAACACQMESQYPIVRVK